MSYESLHEGCVKLEVLVGRTDMVAGRENALKDEGRAHGVENAVVVRDASAHLELCILGVNDVGAVECGFVPEKRW